jgi:hypothetical protein
MQSQNRDRVLARVKRLMELFESGALGPTSHEVHPELQLGSVENYLYFTLPVALNFQRRSEGLWAAALDTFRDQATRFVFSPLAVVENEAETAAALISHRLALQANKHVNIWLTLSRSLHDNYDGDPRKLLAAGDNDVPVIIEYLQSRKRSFPYLSGPKMSNYWLYILSRFTDVQLIRREEISIIPDVHVTRATVRLGLLDPGVNTSPVEVATIWRDILEGTGLAPMDLHAPLWRWSRAGFHPDV